MQGRPAALLPRLLKPSLRYAIKFREQSSVILLCNPVSPAVLLPCLPVPAEAAGMTDDITQQGFGRRCHHGEGISMETLGPLSHHRFMLPPHPSLLRGPSDGRDQDTAQAPEINCVPALYHPYSSHEAFHLLPLFWSALALKLNLSTIPLTPFKSNCQLLTCATIKS